MSGWRTALRVAWREAKRAKGRAALVVGMITLPVAALSFAAVSYDTFTLTPAERADRLMGTAKAVIGWPVDGPVEQGSNVMTSFAVGPPGPPAEPTLDRLLAHLPPGASAITDQKSKLTVRTASGVGTIPARILDYANPLAHGILRQLSGRAPAGPGEVALTPAAATRIGADVGSAVRLADGSHTLQVVGIAEEPDKLDATTIVLSPGALPPDVLPVERNDLHWLVATPGPLTWAQVKDLNTHGVVAVSRHVLANPPSEDSIRGVESGPPPGMLALIGGLALLEIILLAGPALAIGARRRQRELALVAATGGTPAQVRRIVLADGVVVGALAAAAGVVVGVAAAVAAHPVLEETLRHARSGAFRVFPAALAILAGLAVVTGVLAALVPAWISSRQDVVAALAGRRGVTRSRRRWLIIGVVLVAAGVVIAAVGVSRIDHTVILAGVVVGELGLVLCTPVIVGLVARSARWLPVAPRIALRHTSRNRTAAAPAISAVMAAVLGSVVIGVVLTSTSAVDPNYESAGRRGDVMVSQVIMTKPGAPLPSRPSLPPDAIAKLRGNMPVEQFHEIRLPTCGDESCSVAVRVPPAQDCPYSLEILQREPTDDEQRAARRDSRCDGVGATRLYFGGYATPYGIVVVIDETAAPAVTDVPAGDVDRIAAALRAGAVVVSDPAHLENGRVTLNIDGHDTDSNHQDTGQRKTVSAAGFAMPHRPKAPIAMMTNGTANSLGLGPATLWTTLVTTSRVPTVEEEDRLQAALGIDFSIKVDRGTQTNTADLLVLAIVAGLIALGAAALATGLVAADGRAELGTLAAVGASPRVRRALSLSQSGVIAGLGSLLGVAAGLGASTAVLFALNQRYADVWPVPKLFPITVPWLNVGIALIVVPLVAMLGAGLLTRSRLPIDRRG